MSLSEKQHTEVMLEHCILCLIVVPGEIRWRGGGGGGEREREREREKAKNDIKAKTKSAVHTVRVGGLMTG